MAQGSDSTLLVTNMHVVESDPSSVYVVLDYWDWRSGGAQKIKAEVVAPWDDVDLVFLETQTPLEGYTVLPLLSSDNVGAAQDVYALGFPGISDEIVDNGEAIPSTAEDITVTKGIISKIDAQISGVDYYQMDVSINGGNSGGPLVTEDGYVIGINTLGSTSSESMNFAIHIDYIINAMAEAGIQPVLAGDAEITPEPSAAPAQQSPSEQPAQSADPAPTASAAQTPQPEQPSSGGDNTIWYILIGVGVIGIVIYALSSAKKKSPRTQAVMPAAMPRPGAEQAAAQVQLLCTAGQFAGSTFTVNGRIFIGRDPRQCEIVFPASSPGISARHCEIRAEGAGALITDLGSSYGTFVGAVKLEANRPYALRSGDSFYLADHQNEFKLL